MTCQARDTIKATLRSTESKTTAMRIIITLLACATTHGFLAPPRHQPAQTVRLVKVDTDNFFFKALDGAKELAFKAGDLVQDAGDLAKDARDRAQEARAPKVKPVETATPAPAKQAPFDLASAFNKAPAAPKVDAPAAPVAKQAPFSFMKAPAAPPPKVAAPPAAPVAKKTPFDFGGLASAVQAKKPSAKQAPFDFKAANEASKARVDAALVACWSLL